MTIAAWPDPPAAADVEPWAGPGGGLVEWALKADAANRIARWLAPTAFVPESLRVRNQQTGEIDLDLTIMQVTAVLLKGDELTLPPMAALEAIDIIPPGSGTPALRAKVLGALLHQRGHHYWTVEQTATRCTLRGRARGALEGQPDEEARWDIDRAKALVGQRKMGDPSGNWRKQPATMLYWRALADLARKIAPEVMLGLPVVDVEVDDEPEDSPDGAAPGSPRGQRQRGRAASGRGTRSRAAAAPIPPTASAAPGVAAAPDDGEQPPMIEDAQRRALWAGMRDLGITGRDASLRMVSSWIGREVTSSNDLTKEEAGKALDAITAARDQRAARADAQEAAEAAEASQDTPDDPGPDEPAPDE